MQNKSRQYEAERKERWSMAKEGELSAMEAIEKRLSTYYGLFIHATRYDEQYFEKYDPQNVDNSWVRGASDYAIKIDGEDILIEIKLKNKKFRKTNGGGVTRDGSIIRDYGCESFYLDINPVYKNMCEFCTHEGINPASFIIFFCGDDNNELRYISLAKINELVIDGYKGSPLTEYGEGYGINTENGRAITYLIPEDTTIDISDRRIVFQMKNEDRLSYILHRYIQRVYGYNSSGFKYYHINRNCSVIKNRSDNVLNYFFSKSEAEEQGFHKCNYCGGE